MTFEDAAERFVAYVHHRVIRSARGDDVETLDVDPSGRFWLGRLAPECRDDQGDTDPRLDRLAPCAIGIRVRVLNAQQTVVSASIGAVAWVKRGSSWAKRPSCMVSVQVALGELKAPGTVSTFGSNEIRRAFGESFETGHTAEIRAEVTRVVDGVAEVEITLLNTTSIVDHGIDPNLYECSLRLENLETLPFVLEALPDSFRYDRSVPAYGINAGIELGVDGSVRTVDAPTCDTKRPSFWNSTDPKPDLSFRTLAADPVAPLHELARAYRRWWETAWSPLVLDRRAREECWVPEMSVAARAAADACHREVARISAGVNLLEHDATLNRAFRLMNRAIAHSAREKYSAWRPFQVAFLLANLPAVKGDASSADIADVVWFQTGGGKTETYLGLIVTAAFYDRMTGKESGITAWSRFPLRMLSLQQTQRFADIMAGAEIVRRVEAVGGDPFAVGFFVGSGATPNRIDPDPPPGSGWDPDDEAMPEKGRVLIECPFCREESIEMGFDRAAWRLEHRCTNSNCPWPERALPFFVVDDEIYRFLPTVVVGTLDKAASIAFQQAMRGFVAAPWGRCTREGHGFTYAPRSKKPNGCLVPGCEAAIAGLDTDPDRFAPTLRLQDELHLLRDSLGAVDAHYESLLDGLQRDLSGRQPTILASSATLTGANRQIDVLYRRTARIFPTPGPSPGNGFWSADSDRLMRRYVALSPRGVTLEYAHDRILTDLQGITRELVSDPAAICSAAGVPEECAESLARVYGVDVLYGNTLRDLDAVIRSIETQIDVSPPVNSAELTSRVGFEAVRLTLKRLEAPEADFEKRIHAITASSMMSHGVDIDRLNKMVVLGLPLTASEFIQATARVGRTFPGLVLVLGKIARERDAAVFRNFEKFVSHGDRFIEPIPVTRRSRRVLENTAPGLLMARTWMVHEPAAQRALSKIAELRRFLDANGVTVEKELNALSEWLGFKDSLDEFLLEDLERIVELYFNRIESPPPDARWTGDLAPGGGPMMSLRDVDEQAPVMGIGS